MRLTCVSLMFFCGSSFIQKFPIRKTSLRRVHRNYFFRSKIDDRLSFQLRIAEGDPADGFARSDAEGASVFSTDLDDSEPVELPDLTPPQIILTESERLRVWEEICELEPQWKDAIESNNSAVSDVLLNRINELKASEPYFNLMDSMNNALANDNFSKAAILKLKMSKIGVPTKLLEKVKNGSTDIDGSPSVRQAVKTALASDEASAASLANEMKASQSYISKDGSQMVYSSHSDVTTNQVQVQVWSQYYPEQSNPSKHHYIFLYKVKIINNSPFIVQLISRKWVISCINAKTKKTEVQEVSGSGVVGQQPILEPGESFEYTSACPITQPPKDNIRVIGRMEGLYLMVTGSNGQHYFQAKIKPFYFILPEDVMP